MQQFLQFFILTFIYSSTCFGRSPAHNQELNGCSSSLWFYLFLLWILYTLYTMHLLLLKKMYILLQCNKILTVIRECNDF
jgi:hypothetical protein